jgi:hypothetical protein
MRGTTLGICAVLMLLLAGCTEGTTSPAQVGPREVPMPQGDEGQVRGFVTDDSGLPVPEAQVALLGVEPARSVVADATGMYVLAGLSPGEYQVAAGRLGYDSKVVRALVKPGEVTQVDFMLRAIAAAAETYSTTIIGQGYIACGAYLYLVTISNLNVCAWDTNHKPRFEFSVARDNLKGIVQEVTWTKSSALTSDKLIVYLWYKPVCNPTCSGTKQFAADNARSPIRQYGNLEKETFEEDPVPLASMTFVGGSGVEVVFVFQQRIEHYITAFYNGHGDLETFTALP